MNRRTVLKNLAALLASPLAAKIAGHAPAQPKRSSTWFSRYESVDPQSWQERQDTITQLLTIERGHDLYVGPGGHDDASGLTYADRWLSVQTATGRARRGDRVICTSDMLCDRVTLGQQKETDGQAEAKRV